MPIIPINDKYRLSSDFDSWELQERTKRKHRKTSELVEVWKAIKWYRSTETALHAALELCLRTSDAKEINIAINEVKGLLASVRQALISEINGKQEADK